MAYVPPHMRNRQEQPAPSPPRAPRRVYEKPRWKAEKERTDKDAEEKRKAVESSLVRTEENFPALGSAVPPPKEWTGARKFNELAADWKQHDEETKEQEELEKQRKNRNNSTFILPHFRNIHRYTEPEDQGYEEDVETFKEDNDEWNVVDRKKVRKPKITREITEEEYQAEAEAAEKEDDTVWGNVPEEHETCWDERRY